ncbi:MAG: glucosaminidase domain-containing protein [Prevotellaceae bacterium]|nr:glucosaminidase domain-containing protein [Prevotellaceae bacterium]
MYMIKTLFTGFLWLLTSVVFSQQAGKITREEYIAHYKDLAIKQMKESGIPASITLAQGCLESGNGNSRLSVEGNNHFGIKCHSSWTGERIYHDDDALQECFRKYTSAEGSYNDHSDFLRYRDRYKFLFDLPPTDYKAWAHGLKKAGYATNPSYAEQLIKIIEDYKLYLYDVDTPVDVPPPSKIEKPKQVETASKRRLIVINRELFERNGALYIQTRTNDTYELIANEYNIKLKRLLAYNDEQSDRVLEKGQVVYLSKKKRKADKLQPIHIANDNETMWQIAQRYAVRLKSIENYNNMQDGRQPEEGQEIYLRNKMSR